MGGCTAGIIKNLRHLLLLPLRLQPLTSQHVLALVLLLRRLLLLVLRWLLRLMRLLLRRLLLRLRPLLLLAQLLLLLSTGELMRASSPPPSPTAPPCPRALTPLTRPPLNGAPRWLKAGPTTREVAISEGIQMCTHSRWHTWVVSQPPTMCAMLRTRVRGRTERRWRRRHLLKYPSQDHLNHWLLLHHSRSPLLRCHRVWCTMLLHHCLCSCDVRSNTYSLTVCSGGDSCIRVIQPRVLH